MDTSWAFDRSPRGAVDLPEVTLMETLVAEFYIDIKVGLSDGIHNLRYVLIYLIHGLW